MALPSDIKAVIADRALRRAGLRAVAIIRDRTLSGIGVDENGNAYPLPAYSEKTFAMPAGRVTKDARARLKGRLKFFKTKAGTRWVLVEGGYRAYKAARYPQHGGVVNLSAEGRMLRALSIVSVDPATGNVRIGFTRQEEALKAYYNALRNRRILGLTQQEREEIARIVAEGITFIT
jgi:hypothetical protein